MSASHNPGGPKEDWGIKFNYTNGEPAPEKITDKIFGFTEKIQELKVADIPDTDLAKLGVTKHGDFEVSHTKLLSPLLWGSSRCPSISDAAIDLAHGSNCPGS